MRESDDASEAGASLLELVVATAAGLVILAATMQGVSAFQRQFTSQQSALIRQQDLRLGLELLEQELHLAQPDSLSIMEQDEMEFGANIHGLATLVTAPAMPGQTTISIEDGRQWPERKTIIICWDFQCDTMTLAREGQRTLLSVTQPIPLPIPAGAFVSIRNRVRYYSRRDDKGIPRLLRQVDGGASVLVGNIQAVKFSYWDTDGQRAAAPTSVGRIVVEVTLPDTSIKMVREISLRT